MPIGDIFRELSWLPPLLVGAGLPPLTKFLWSWPRRPILAVYKSRSPEETYVEVALDREGHRGRFVALKVRNLGARAAKGCYAKLVRLERRTADDAWERILEFRDPEMLAWANRGGRGFEEQSIERDIPQTIDLCFADERLPQFVCFDVRHGELTDGRQRNYVDGAYRATVRVYADGVRPATAQFLITKGAGWKNVTVRQMNGKGRYRFQFGGGKTRGGGKSLMPLPSMPSRYHTWRAGSKRTKEAREPLVETVEQGTACPLNNAERLESNPASLPLHRSENRECAAILVLSQGIDLLAHSRCLHRSR